MSAAADAWEEEAELMLHGKPYLLSISVRGDELAVACELVTSGDRWKASFVSAYLEEITQKTGSFKRFGVFAQMLRSAAAGAADSLSLDILTAADLELLKTKRLRTPAVADGGGSAAPPSSASSKRYLILTYVAEFDRVHYPLPLTFEVAPSADQVRVQLRELRAEVEALRRSGGKVPADFARLERDNSELRAKLDWRAADSRASERLLAGAEGLEERCDKLRRQNAQLEEALDGVRREAQREVKAIKRECAKFADAHGDSAADADALVDERHARAEAAAESKRLRRYCKELEHAAAAQHDAHMRELRRAGREKETALAEAQRARDGEGAMRLKLRAASSELNWLKAKGTAAAGARSTHTTPVGLRPSSRAPSRAGSARAASRDPSPASSRGSSPSGSARSLARDNSGLRSGSAPSRRPAGPVSPHLYQPRQVYRRESPSPRQPQRSASRSAPTSRAGSAERGSPDARRWADGLPVGERGGARASAATPPPSARPSAERPSAAFCSSSVGLSPRPYDSARADADVVRGRPPAPRPPLSGGGWPPVAASGSPRPSEGRGARARKPPSPSLLASASDSDGESVAPAPVRVPVVRSAQAHALRAGAGREPSAAAAAAASALSDTSDESEGEPELLVRARAFKENAGATGNRPSGSSVLGGKGESGGPARVDIKDIDSRLSALQDFLRKAKAMN
ncbi:hypothetical protein T492DRAFT_1149808 [Pavlovales sp. CCMP2436]|nr:hypothetical protein T492DRAFT_1149808 [Pavlovales sp. CCMP2436]